MTSFEKFAEILHATVIWSYLCYGIDLGIVSYIFEDEDFKNQWQFVVSLTDNLWPKNSRSCATFLPEFSYIGQDLCYQKDLSVCSHIFEVKDHEDKLYFMLTVDLQIQGHVHFGVTFHISGWVRSIREISESIPTYSRSRITIMIITAISTVDLQIQIHTLYCVTFHISGWRGQQLLLQ